MASSTLHKFLRRSNLSGAVASTLRSVLRPQQDPVLLHNLQDHAVNHGLLGQILGSPEKSPIQNQMYPIFPSFRLGFCVEPIYSNSPVDSAQEDDESVEQSTLWADSVKKKRKKKMNKHKYKKLRKRLRRKT